jgi:uncharacterized membrane protein
LDTIGSAEEILISFVRGLRLALEAVGAFWIAVGFVYALIELITAHVRRRTGSFTAIRLTFSRYLSLALEFQLASDILSTAVAPTWQEIGKLGATAVIRTALNYFLSREMREYKGKEEREERQLEQLAGPPAEA